MTPGSPKTEIAGTAMALGLFAVMIIMAFLALARVDEAYGHAERALGTSMLAMLRDAASGDSVDDELMAMTAALDRLDQIAVDADLDAAVSGLWRAAGPYREDGVADEAVLDGLLARFGVLEAALSVRRRALSSSFYWLMAALLIMLVGSVAAASRLVVRLRVSRIEAEWSRKGLAASLEAEEELRRRIASELHDDAAQDIAAAKMLCERAAAQASGPPRDRSMEAAELLASAGRKIRSLSLDLRPPALDGHGLQSAIEALCERARALGADVSCSMDGSLPWLPGESAIHAYRIVQESLANALKHAAGHPVTVGVRASEGCLKVEVADSPPPGRSASRAESRADGPAAPSADPSVSSGLGMAIMAERAALLGGSIQVESGAEGYVVRLCAPCPPAGGTHE